ncbi:MAG: hypothetical protein Q9201_001821 [Fulgogasparrea decipioides]
MDLPLRPSNIIEIPDDSDDGHDVRLEDFMTAEELQATFPRPLDFGPGLAFQEVQDRQYHQSTEVDLPSSVVPYEVCLKDVLEVFPDVSHDHVKGLYDTAATPGSEVFGISLSEHLISQILDGGKYPKERDRLNELKRKRSLTQNSDEERAARWQAHERLRGDTLYATQAKNLLQEDFPDVPRRFIDLKYKEHSFLYATYLALDLAEDTYDTSTTRPYTRLKNSRKPKISTSSTHEAMYPTGYGYAELRKELEAARTQRKKLQTQRQIRKDATAAEAAEEKELRDNKQVMECGCCFDDIPINKITFCSADEPHSFCFACAAQNAHTQIGMSRYVLSCMDGSGCQASFSRMERERFLDDKTIEKLDRLQQQTELRQANVPNLETCPFCDFAAECPPIETDKEFRCKNPECEKVSCRQCRLVTHIPLNCEEFRKENGLSERHQIEEARSNALIRTCPKCKASIVKDLGCNKVRCTICHTAICDVCGKDITKDQYLHFNTNTTLSSFKSGGKCPQFDMEGDRHEKDMDAAEKEALKKIREENPDLSEEDLKIKFNESVQSPPRKGGYRPPGYMPGFPGMPDYMNEMLRGVPPWAVPGPMPPLPYAARPRPNIAARARPPRRGRADDDIPRDVEQAFLDEVLLAEGFAPPQRNAAPQRNANERFLPRGQETPPLDQDPELYDYEQTLAMRAPLPPRRRHGPHGQETHPAGIQAEERRERDRLAAIRERMDRALDEEQARLQMELERDWHALGIDPPGAAPRRRENGRGYPYGY